MKSTTSVVGMYLYSKSRDKKINVVFVCNPPFADTKIYTIGMLVGNIVLSLQNKY